MLGYRVVGHNNWAIVYEKDGKQGVYNLNTDGRFIPTLTIYDYFVCDNFLFKLTYAFHQSFSPSREVRVMTINDTEWSEEYIVDIFDIKENSEFVTLHKSNEGLDGVYYDHYIMTKFGEINKILDGFDYDSPCYTHKISVDYEKTFGGYLVNRETIGKWDEKRSCSKPTKWKIISIYKDDFTINKSTYALLCRTLLNITYWLAYIRTYIEYLTNNYSNSDICIEVT